MKLLKFILPVAGILALFYSCKEDKITLPIPSYNYFPTDYGRFVVYNADSIVHRTDDNNNDDSISYYHYQLKDVIDSTFPDLEGKKRQVILRYYKDSITDWTLRNVWSQLLTSSAAYRYEDNISYHKLAFPISSSIKWNGNDMNTDGEELYSYQGIHVSDSYNSFQFDSTINVLQIDEILFIGRTYGVEIYAENVGLIYKERDELTYNGAQQISSGTEYKLIVVDYGPR
jgi:hypothetical protein